MSFRSLIPGLGLLGPEQPPVIATNHALPPAPASRPIGEAALATPSSSVKLAESSLENIASVKEGLPVKNNDESRDGCVQVEEPGVPSTTAGDLNDAPALSRPDSIERDQKTDLDFLQAAEANKDNPNAEWQLDSSSTDSSVVSDTSSNTSSEEESDDEEYSMLEAREAAQMLMREEYGDDDGRKGTGTDLRTTNEVVEAKIEKPDVTVTPEMKITELGRVETVVGNMILLKANTSGEYQVLESGSVLCKDDRTVIGAVAETLGRVREPLYTIAFNSSDEIREAGLVKGTTIYFANDHSTYVFTQALQNLKGTDASNQFDEETGENEIEFSDDEVEAEYKRQQKQKKRDAHAEKSGARPDRKPHQQKPHQGVLSHDDEETDMYIPMKRPDNLHHQMMHQGWAPTEEQPGSYKPHHRGGRGRRSGRGGAPTGTRPRGTFGKQQQQQQSIIPPLLPQIGQPVSQPMPMPFHFTNSQPYAWPQNGLPSFDCSQRPSNFPVGTFLNPAFFQGQQQQPHYGAQTSYQTAQQATGTWCMSQANIASDQGQNSHLYQSQDQHGGSNGVAAIQHILSNLINQNNNVGSS